MCMHARMLVKAAEGWTDQPSSAAVSLLEEKSSLPAKPEKRFLMDVMIHQQAEREAQRVQANREELVERIARAMREDGTTQPLQGLHLYRRSSPLEQVYS